MEEFRNEPYTTEWCGDCCKDDLTEYDSSEHESHLVEKSLAHLLATRPDVEFDSLVIRRISDDAVCLEGVIKTMGEDIDIDNYIKALYGVDVVINRLVTRCPCVSEKTAPPVEKTVTDWRS